MTKKHCVFLRLLRHIPGLITPDSWTQQLLKGKRNSGSENVCRGGFVHAPVGEQITRGVYIYAVEWALPAL
jgi:hypothetical protein